MSCLRQKAFDGFVVSVQGIFEFHYAIDCDTELFIDAAVSQSRRFAGLRIDYRWPECLPTSRLGDSNGSSS